jgi:uncharacterized protein YcnI
MKKAAAVVAALVALAVPAAAAAHATVSPVVAEKGHLQLFTLAVPTEKEGAVTTKVELTPPDGFGIDSFVPAAGWSRTVQQSGSGEEATVTKVTWSGGKIPTGEDATFSFLAEPSSSGTYAFQVRQTYSDGSVVDWNGPESSDSPSPTIDVRSSLGGGGGSSTLDVVAIVLAGIAIGIGVLALVVRGGRELA